MMKISGSKTQERHFWLFNDMLVYAKVKSMKKDAYQFKGFIPMTMLLANDLPDSNSHKNAIELQRVDLKKKYIIYPKEGAENVKARWMLELESRIDAARSMVGGHGVVDGVDVLA
jgi:SOS1/NGEF-like PH domain